MPRPKGSKNKPKTVKATVDFAAQITEKQAAKEVIDSLKQIPPDGADFVRGYLQGRLDGIKAEKKEDKE